MKHVSKANYSNAGMSRNKYNKILNSCKGHITKRKVMVRYVEETTYEGR